MSYKISPEVFFLVENGQVLLWNCLSHEQYLLTKEDFIEILHCSAGESFEKRDIFETLQKTGIIVTSENTPEHPWGFDTLSRLFHVGTKNIPTDKLSCDPDLFSQSYIDECTRLKDKIPDFFQEKNAHIIDLPVPSLEFNDIRFSEVLKNRKTTRSFNGKPISLQQLSNLLYAGFGLIHGEWKELSEKGLKIVGIRKSSPASGALHPEEAYIIVFNVEGLEPGLYYYRPQDHRLNQLRTGNFSQQIIEYNNRQFYSKDSALGIYITARLDKYWWKYQHSRSYRFMLVDIGHVSQATLMAATALGLRTWMSGAFQERPIEDFLGIDGYQENVIVYIGIGFGDNVSFPESFR